VRSPHKKLSRSLCQERHRHQEWLRSLRLIDFATPPDKDLCLIVDNYVRRKHLKVQRWLARHPRLRSCFTPTSSSWLNIVERFFRDLTHNRLRRGVFRDAEELITAIDQYVDRHNEAPQALHLDGVSQRHHGEGQARQNLTA
jgi:hypothetical protein